MTEKRFKLRDTLDKNIQCEEISDNGEWITHGEIVDLLNSLSDENEQLKKGMIEVVDRYIKNVECNPPSSARTYMKIKRALNTIREDLRSLIEDLE